MKTVFLDITELRINPIRTGIQRMVRQLIKAWPSDVDVVPVVYERDRNALRILSQDTVEFLLASGDMAGLSLQQAIDQANFLDEAIRSPTLSLRKGDKVHIPELFYDSFRSFFYRNAINAGVDISVWIPDFIPLLHPECFPGAISFHTLMHYYWLLFEVKKRAFISAPVRDDFEKRIYRRAAPDSIVTDLGADGLAIDLQNFSSDRKNLLFLGTFELRKGQHLVYDAFCARRRHMDLTLTFVGAIPPGMDKALLPVVQSQRADVRVLTSASDSEVIEIFKSVRATIFTSRVEGYGLPAMESLYAGVPVVVRDNLPALAGKPDFGQIRLSGADEADILAALDIIGDDKRCADLWNSAKQYPNTTWKAVARQLADWA